MHIAGIGSRELNPDDLHICFQLGQFIVSLGGELHTGNAEGADQAFANGANMVKPERVHLHLPWASFNREAINRGNVIHLPQDQSHHEETARMYHKGWHRMGQGGRKLHTRNVSIVVYPQLKDLILAFPSQKWGGGGTGQGMRVGEGLGVPVIDLNGMTQDDLFQLGERIRKLKGK